MARPSIYTKDITDHICQRIVDGESLRQICKDDSLPNRDTIYCWLQSNKAFSDQYTQARMMQADQFFDEMDEIIRKPMQNMIQIQQARLQIDTMKWRLSKMLPKIYGDKVEVNSQSNRDDQSIKVEFVNATHKECHIEK